MYGNNKNAMLSEETKRNLAGVPILASFSQEEQNRILEPTGTQYANVPAIQFFEDRGIANELLADLFKNLTKYGAIIAGGFFESMLLGREIKDLDLFFSNANDFKATYSCMESLGYGLVTSVNKLIEDSTQVRFIHFTHKEAKLPDVQLIKTMWYPDAKSVVDSFDFTAAQFAIDDGRVIFNPLAALDVSRKRLVLHRMTFPASTLRRMIKYTQKGYYVCPGSLQRISMETMDILNKVGQTANGPVYID